MPGSGVAGSSGRPVALKNYELFSPYGCTILHSHQQWIGVVAYQRPYQSLVRLFFSVCAIWTGVWWLSPHDSPFPLPQDQWCWTPLLGLLCWHSCVVFGAVSVSLFLILFYWLVSCYCMLIALCMFWIQTLGQVHALQIFSLVICGFFFHSLNCSIGGAILNLDEIKFIYFSCLDLVLASFLRNLCLTEGHNDFFSPSVSF